MNRDDFEVALKALPRALAHRRYYLRRERQRVGNQALFWTTGDRKPNKRKEVPK